MKKFLAVIMAIVLTFGLVGCSNNKFQAPKNYKSVVFVSINPQFKLYLDEHNVVLAVEPLNKDAQSLGEFEINVGFIEVLQNIVKFSNEKGFIKENATVEVVLSETILPEKAEGLLITAENAIQEIANELKITVTAVTEYNNSLSRNKNS